MYFRALGSYDCNYHFALVFILLESYFILLILVYPAVVIYELEDSHMIDRTIQECTVCETLNLEYLCAFVFTIITFRLQFFQLIIIISISVKHLRKDGAYT